MRIGVMLGDIARSLFKRPMTEKYPYVRYEAPKLLRSQLTWDVEKCTGCGLCVKDCPARALELITVDKASKRYVMVFRADCCTFCGQCEKSCMRGAIDLNTDDWELAALTKGPFAHNFGRQGDVDAALAESAPKPAA